MNEYHAICIFSTLKMEIGRRARPTKSKESPSRRCLQSLWVGGIFSLEGGHEFLNCLLKCLVLRRSSGPSYVSIILPFTDWQNDLHLILGFDLRLLHRPLLDLATLIATATRVFLGTVSIGSCEDRSGYVYCRVPH